MHKLFQRFSKSIIGAERGAFFVVEKDRDRNELVAERYDENEEMDIPFRKNVKFYIDKDKGIVGRIATTGETISLREAYLDPRYNKDIDCKSGYITKSLLAVPIKGLEGILGVIELINKGQGNCFTESDQYILETFSVYSALALHFSRILNDHSHLVCI